MSHENLIKNAAKVGLGSIVKVHLVLQAQSSIGAIAAGLRLLQIDTGMATVKHEKSSAY